MKPDFKIIFLISQFSKLFSNQFNKKINSILMYKNCNFKNYPLDLLKILSNQPSPSRLLFLTFSLLAWHHRLSVATTSHCRSIISLPTATTNHSSPKLSNINFNPTNRLLSQTDPHATGGGVLALLEPSNPIGDPPLAEQAPQVFFSSNSIDLISSNWPNSFQPAFTTTHDSTRCSLAFSDGTTVFFGLPHILFKKP